MMPRFMLKTPPMRRRAKAMQQIVDRMQRTHTAAQRVGMHEDVVDAYLALHASDPQFLPESDLSLPLGAILMTAMYMGDQVGFALYWLLQSPELYERVTAEATPCSTTCRGRSPAGCPGARPTAAPLELAAACSAGGGDPCWTSASDRPTIRADIPICPR